jgi:hypothetical protein
VDRAKSSGAVKSGLRTIVGCDFRAGHRLDRVVGTVRGSKQTKVEIFDYKMSTIFKTKNAVLITCGILILLAAASLPRATAAQKTDKGIPKQQRTMSLGEDDVKNLLLLMDTDRNGKISKKEFMDFMSAEFDRLDKDKSGELDAKELRDSQIRPAARPPVGK